MRLQTYDNNDDDDDDAMDDDVNDDGDSATDEDVDDVGNGAMDDDGDPRSPRSNRDSHGRGVGSGSVLQRTRKSMAFESSNARASSARPPTGRQLSS